VGIHWPCLFIVHRRPALLHFYSNLPYSVMGTLVILPEYRVLHVAHRRKVEQSEFIGLECSFFVLPSLPKYRTGGTLP